MPIQDILKDTGSKYLAQLNERKMTQYFPVKSWDEFSCFKVSVPVEFSKSQPLLRFKAWLVAILHYIIDSLSRTTCSQTIPIIFQINWI